MRTVYLGNMEITLLYQGMFHKDFFMKVAQMWPTYERLPCITLSATTYERLFDDLHINPFSTGTGWTLYKVYGGFRISYGMG